MIPSIEGLIVAAVLLLTGYLLGAPLIIGLFASLAFGATAFATLTALGGSSPLIYTLFAAGIITAVALRINILRELGTVFKRFPAAWTVVLLTAYAIVSAMIFPRLFAGQTTAFVPVEGVVTELPLAPTGGNITQTAYFMLGALTFLALSILLLQEKNLKYVWRGFLVFVIVNVSLGVVDLAGKVVGIADILLPIRTASYTLHTATEQAGFWRIAGGFAEASGFGAASLTCLAFIYVYWRATGARFAFVLTVTLLVLILLSTSSTAYGGLAILCLAPLASLMRSAFRNQFTADDLLLVALGAGMLAIVTSIFLYNERLFDPVVELVQATILDKPLSTSALERAYWNEQGLQAFVDSRGLGIGMGSSRTSSWVISVLSQLGVVGALAVLTLLLTIFRGMRRLSPNAATADIFSLAASVRAAIIAHLVALTIAGSSADPGILFFISLSAILACRNLAAGQGEAAGSARLHPSTT